MDLVVGRRLGHAAVQVLARDPGDLGAHRLDGGERATHEEPRHAGDQRDHERDADDEDAAQRRRALVDRIEARRHVQREGAVRARDPLGEHAERVIVDRQLVERAELAPGRGHEPLGDGRVARDVGARGDHAAVRVEDLRERLVAASLPRSPEHAREIARGQQRGEVVGALLERGIDVLRQRALLERDHHDGAEHERDRHGQRGARRRAGPYGARPVTTHGAAASRR